jgi:VIT1/CCC1 family predicted Fe2+/Mn2+ transporter
MEREVDTEEHEIDELIDEVSSRLAESLVSKLVIWFVRTCIGLSISGILWYFFSWGFWIFVVYALIAFISLFVVLYVHFKLLKAIADVDPDYGRIDDNEDYDSPN